MPVTNTRRALVEAARGDRPLDLVIRGGQLVNVFTDEIQPADVGIFGDRIAVVDVGRAYRLEAPAVIQAAGPTLLPRPIHTPHPHQSTMGTPPGHPRAGLPVAATHRRLRP